MAYEASREVQVVAAMEDLILTGKLDGADSLAVAARVGDASTDEDHRMGDPEARKAWDAGMACGSIDRASGPRVITELQNFGIEPNWCG